MDQADVIFLGEQHTITLPSGRVVVIRETNGEDDAILSTLKDAGTGESVMNFLANIVISEAGKEEKVTVKNIKKWHSSDRYYLFFKQRLINKGDVMPFQYICQADGCPANKEGEKPFELEQDLKEFDGDLSDEKYKPTRLGQVMKYEKGLDMEVFIETPKGVKLRFDILTGDMEQSRREIPVGDNNKNTALVIRRLAIFQNNTWERLYKFYAFSSKEMSFIRTEIERIDPLFDPRVKFACPICGTPYNIPLMVIPAFFWPEETI